MEENKREISTKKAIYISSSILAPFLLLKYWQPILEIGLVGGTTFGVLFLLVKYHKKLFEQVQKSLKWLSSLVTHKENEETL